jgi:serine/threonine protein phosphatase PrpC
MMPDSWYPEAGARTETGFVRRENQDRMSCARIPWGHLYLVADGMGGHAGGAQAAELTVSCLEYYLAKTSRNVPVEAAIRSAFAKTNRDVYDKAHAGDPATEGMGSTAVLLLLFNHTAKIAHVGDSRAYLYRGGKLHRLTKDHTLVQKMVDTGLLTPEQARHHPSSNILDRAVGNAPSVLIDITPDLALNPGDGLLLCTDGLSGYVSDEEMEAALSDSSTPQENADRLIYEALQKGGTDNVTVQFIRCGNRPADE